VRRIKKRKENQNYMGKVQKNEQHKEQEENFGGIEGAKIWGALWRCEYGIVESLRECAQLSSRNLW
jgi:hypothetical protein